MISIVRYALLVALMLAAPGLAQQATGALSEQEQASLKAAQANVDTARADRDKAWQLIQQTSVRDVAGCIAAIGTAHEVEKNVAIAEAMQRAVVAEVKANHGCAACDVVDGRLVKK
jgi:hypothetical protein